MGVIGITDVGGVLVVCSAWQEDDELHQNILDSSRRAISLHAVGCLTADVGGACVHGPERGRVEYRKCRSYNRLRCLSHRLVDANRVKVSDRRKKRGVGESPEPRA